MILSYIALTISTVVVQVAHAGADGAAAPKPSIVPQPARMEVSPGAFRIAGSTSILVEAGNADVRAVGEFLAKRWLDTTGHVFAVKASNGSNAPEGAILLTTLGADASLGDEGYGLTVTPKSIVLRAPRAHGLFYAVHLRWLTGFVCVC